MVKKVNLTEDNDKKLLSLGFKKVWLDDKSGYWLEKKVDIGEFKSLLICDDVYCTMEIQVLTNVESMKPRKQYEPIWKGSFKQLLIKAKKYK